MFLLLPLVFILFCLINNKKSMLILDFSSNPGISLIFDPNCHCCWDLCDDYNKMPNAHKYSIVFVFLEIVIRLWYSLNHRGKWMHAQKKTYKRSMGHITWETFPTNKQAGANYDKISRLDKIAISLWKGSGQT